MASILICGCWQKLFGTVAQPQCQIIRTVDGEDDFIIHCIIINNVWWITEGQFYDLALRNGLTEEEVARRAEGDRVWHASVAVRRGGTFFDRKTMDARLEDEKFVGRLTAYMLEKGVHDDEEEADRLRIIKRLIFDSYPHGRRLARRTGQDVTESQLEFTINDELKLQDALKFDDQDDAIKRAEIEF